MSNVSAAPPDFDFWEFVNCARCQIPFVSPSGATIPFWLTECGHVVCNNHLNADQSCSVCSSPGIQLVPLQQEMDPPMSDWFRSIPYTLDSIAYAAKFQQDSMAVQIRSYRLRHQQQRTYIEKLKHEIVELRNRLQYATQQTDYQQHQHAQAMSGSMNHRQIDMQEPSNALNNNGKRPMMNLQRPMTGSSSRSDLAQGVGPNRLTLPPGQHPQSLSSSRPEAPHEQQPQRPRHSQRPGSRSFQQQYAYVPPSTPRVPPPQITHAQNRSHDTNMQRSNVPPPPSSAVAMPPPPLPGASKFKPAQTNIFSSGPNHQQNMRPPATQARDLHRQANAVASSSNVAVSNNNRFLPPSERFALPGNNVNSSSNLNAGFGGGTKRFVPPTPSGNTISRSASMAQAAGSGSGNRAPLARAGTAMTNNGGGQRVRFMPGAGF